MVLISDHAVPLKFAMIIFKDYVKEKKIETISY